MKMAIFILGRVHVGKHRKYVWFLPGVKNVFAKPMGRLGGVNKKKTKKSTNKTTHITEGNAWLPKSNLKMSKYPETWSKKWSHQKSSDFKKWASQKITKKKKQKNDEKKHTYYRRKCTVSKSGWKMQEKCKKTLKKPKNNECSFFWPVFSFFIEKCSFKTKMKNAGSIKVDVFLKFHTKN